MAEPVQPLRGRLVSVESVTPADPRREPFVAVVFHLDRTPLPQELASLGAHVNIELATYAQQKPRVKLVAERGTNVRPGGRY